MALNEGAGGNPETTADTPNLTASDLKDAAGISYRQINDWDSKGALPGVREGQAGWRKFSAREVFAIMVCSEIRKRFGVPVESLRFIRSFMLQEGANHLQYAVETMAMGFTVWLMTDLRESFVMDTDLEFEDLFGLGYFRGDDPLGFVFIKISPIANRLLGTLKTPIQLHTNDATYEKMDSVRWHGRVRDEKERVVLDLIRNRAFMRVEVQLRDGDIVEARTEAEVDGRGREVSDDEIQRIIMSHGYQTVTLTKRGGRVIRVTQVVPLPLRDPPAPVGATATPQRDPDGRGGDPKKR